ncbi:unnamed protein product [Fusarium venenatum]|uniref:Uncharacterized protein n=1 Tax=Fusarium venenatum TaxID=56646 RepID=A0A2L2TLH8_9HYPO|nr:uncharacterized protein FVRRES_11056 [Fusarium venenatum]CEI70979.1 unnamed protein product [Fusarium venenatum]
MCRRGVELHHGQTEELVLPGTSYSMLSDQLEMTRRVRTAQQPSRPASYGISREVCLASEWHGSLTISEKMK